MPRRPRDAPRKAPTQERARATVDAILRAAAHILKTQGYDGCSTNAVAKKAGVSIGSLYQYFPSKDALITALAQEHADRAFAQLVAAAQAASGGQESLQDTITRYIRGMVAMHHVDPALHRVHTEQVPRISSGVALVRHISARSAELVRAWLEANRSQLREVDLEIATFMLVTSVEAVTHMLVLDRPPHLDQEGLVRELSALVMRYLGVQTSSNRQRPRRASGALTLRSTPRIV